MRVGENALFQCTYLIKVHVFDNRETRPLKHVTVNHVFYQVSLYSTGECASLVEYTSTTNLSTFDIKVTPMPSSNIQYHIPRLQSQHSSLGRCCRLRAEEFLNKLRRFSRNSGQWLPVTSKTRSNHEQLILIILNS